MAVTTNFNVRIDGVPFVEQPSRLTPHPPGAERFSPILGGFYSFSQEKGWTFDLEWGSEALSDADAFAEADNFQANNGYGRRGRSTVNLTFTWYDGNDYTFAVLWSSAVEAALRWGTNVEKFKITLYEAAQVQA